MDPVRATIGIVVSFFALLAGVMVMGLLLPNTRDTQFRGTVLTISDVIGLAPDLFVGGIVTLLAIIVFFAASSSSGCHRTVRIPLVITRQMVSTGGRCNTVHRNVSITWQGGRAEC